MQLYDGMGTDVGSLMIECSVTICDVLNKDESTPSVRSTQLLWLISSKDASTLSVTRAHKNGRLQCVTM